MENTYMELWWHSYFCFYFPHDAQCSVSATPYRKVTSKERGCLVLHLIKIVPSGHPHPVFMPRCLTSFFNSLNSGHMSTIVEKCLLYHAQWHRKSCT